MKKILSLFAAVLFAGSMMAEGLLFEQTYPGEPSSKVSSYSKSFTLTTGNYTLTYANINNGTNNDAWDAVRSGSKNGASIATVTSNTIAEKVSKVIINFTQIDAAKTNSLALKVADNADFANAVSVEVTIAVGEVEFVVAEPAENKFYQIVLDQAQGTANGFNRWDNIKFISPDGGTPIVPPTYDTLTVAEAIAATQALADNAVSEDRVYVEGYAVNVAAYDPSHASQIFFMVDDVNAPDSVFEAYSAIPMKGGEIYPVLAGDKVRAFGKLKKYVGGFTQLEIVSPIVEFLEEVEGDRTLPGVPVVTIDTITVAEAMTIAQGLTPDKGKSLTTSETYAVRGFVVGASNKYENTWYLADQTNVYGDFQAFKCASVDYAVTENDLVIVSGKITHYYGEGSNGEYHNYEISGGALVHVWAEGIENVTLTEKAQKVMVDGVIYIVRDGKMFDVHGAQVR